MELRDYGYSTTPSNKTQGMWDWGVNGNVLLCVCVCVASSRSYSMRKAASIMRSSSWWAIYVMLLNQLLKSRFHNLPNQDLHLCSTRIEDRSKRPKRGKVFRHVHARTMTTPCREKAAGTTDKTKDCVRTSSHWQKQKTTHMNVTVFLSPPSYVPRPLSLSRSFLCVAFSWCCWFGSFPWPSCPRMDGRTARAIIHRRRSISECRRDINPLVLVARFGQIFRLHRRHLWKARWFRLVHVNCQAIRQCLALLFWSSAAVTCVVVHDLAMGSPAAGWCA